MRIAAVVVTHNRPELLLQALAALRMQTRPLDAIYLVDNASDASSATTAARPGQPDGITVLRPDTNLGGAGGFAFGMAAAFSAGYDWIWLLDDDAIARPDALARLVDALGGPLVDTMRDAVGDTVNNTVSDIGALCGTVREFGGIALQHRRRYDRATGIERALPRRSYDGPPCRADTASFVGMLVPASAIARAGLPEPAFFLSYDDTEYSLRLGRAGLAIWLVPGSRVEHLRERRSRLRAGPFGRKHYFTIRNRIAVARAYASLPMVATGVALLFGLVLWLVSGGSFQRGALRILLRAVRDGLHQRLGPFPDALLPILAHRLPRRAPSPSAGTPSAHRTRWPSSTRR